MLIRILQLIVITIVTCFGLMVIHVEANAAYGAYKQGYLESNVTIIEEEGIKQK